MALIDVVKWETDNKELVHKFPSEDLRIGSQLVVYNGQIAYFVKGGIITDSFEAGTYTLHTDNIPILNKLINIPFGGKSPFQAEVWFVNKLAILDAKWGTVTPIQLEDPKYGIIVPVRAFGQYGLKVADPKLFLETLVGNASSISTDRVDNYFKGKMMSLFANLLSNKITKDNISILSINSQLLGMSKYVHSRLEVEFAKYGLLLSDFNIMSVNVPENDSSFRKLKEAKERATAINVLGRDIYQMDRSFDVLDNAAANEGAGGQFISMGAGLGVGIGVGGSIGNMASQYINTNTISQNITPPALPTPTTYFVYVNGQQLGGQTVQHIASLISNGVVNSETLVWAAGMPTWVKLSQVPELAAMLITQIPPSIPNL